MAKYGFISDSHKAMTALATSSSSLYIYISIIFLLVQNSDISAICVGKQRAALSPLNSVR